MSTDHITDEERLQAAGLPDPLDPTLSTTHIAGDPIAEAGVIRDAIATRLLGVPGDDRRRALSIYLTRSRLVADLWAAAVDEERAAALGIGDSVVRSGWNDEGEYGWSIDRLVYGPTTYHLVCWTDGVANAWTQLVRDEAHADRFLRTLAHVVDTDQTMGLRWEEDMVDCTGWKVDTQIHATVVLAADGTPERVEVPMFFDPDFVLAVTDPDGNTWDVDNDLPDRVADVLGAVEGGSVFAPHI